MTDQPTACIPSEHHVMLTSMAAALSGRITARSIAEHSFAHPGDSFGTILCEAWRVSEWTAVSAMASYMVALRDECSNLQVTPPTFAEVLRVLYLAIKGWLVKKSNIQREARAV